MRERREVNTRLLQEALGSRIEGTSFDLQVQGLGKTIFSPLSQKNQNPNPTPKTHNDTCPPPSKEMPTPPLYETRLRVTIKSDPGCVRVRVEV